MYELYSTTEILVLFKQIFWKLFILIVYLLD